MSRRIAVIYDCLFPFTTGGGERQYRAFAEALVHRGRDVEYVTTRQWRGAEGPHERFAVRAVTGPLRLYDDGGVRSTAAAVRFAVGVFGSLIRRRGDYDAIIVSGLPVLNVFAVRAALVGTRTRIVVDYLEVWGRRQWRGYAGWVTGTLAWILQALAIRVTPLATCHSQLTARRLRAEGLRGRLLLSPGLIETAVDHPARDASAVGPFVLYAGRHIPDKRVEALPAAVRHARRDVPGLRLVITGDGPSTSLVREAVADADATEWTELPGFVDQDALDELMGTAAVLVNPSQREGYGLVVVEAAAHGTPIVLVDDDDNAATELIDVGRNGFVAASADAGDLSEAVVAAVRGGADLRRATRAWYDEAVSARTVQRTVDQLLDVLDQPRADTREPGRAASPRREGQT